jgi:hypothetical protein
MLSSCVYLDFSSDFFPEDLFTEISYAFFISDASYSFYHLILPDLCPKRNIFVLIGLLWWKVLTRVQTLSSECCQHESQPDTNVCALTNAWIINPEYDLHSPVAYSCNLKLNDIKRKYRPSVNQAVSCSETFRCTLGAGEVKFKL